MIYGTETKKICPVCQAWDDEINKHVCLWKENAFDNRWAEHKVLVCHNCGYLQEIR